MHPNLDKCVREGPHGSEQVRAGTKTSKNFKIATKSLKQKKAIYCSRSRQSEWRKGDTSGNTQIIREIRVDCDTDCILLLVDQTGAACHESTRSCFTKLLSETGIIDNAKTAYPTLRISKEF